MRIILAFIAMAIVMLATIQPAQAAPKKGGYTMTTAPGAICPCISNMLCTGPKGGRYCVTANGKKRYK